MIHKKGFNLLKNQVETPTVWTKLYEWVVGTARAILILVELVIVVAIGVRIVLDLQKKNLEKDIHEKEEILLVFQETEKRLKETQQKVAMYESLWKENYVYSDVYTEINRFLPKDSDDISVQLKNDQVFIRGFARTDQVKEIEDGLKSSDSFKNTELVNVESQLSSEIESFFIRTELDSPSSKFELIN